MLPFAHDPGTSIKPGAPSASLLRTLRDSLASALHQLPITPFHKILINGAIIRNHTNSRRINTNLVSNRTFLRNLTAVPHPLRATSCRNPHNFLSPHPTTV